MLKEDFPKFCDSNNSNDILEIKKFWRWQSLKDLFDNIYTSTIELSVLKTGIEMT